jgi:hypothetical protein
MFLKGKIGKNLPDLVQENPIYGNVNACFAALNLLIKAVNDPNQVLIFEIANGKMYLPKDYFEKP